MPGTPVSLGSAVLPSSATTTVVMTAAASAAVGDLVIVTVGNDGGGTVPSGVVDSAGNTYTADDAGHSSVNNYTRRRFSSVITAAITSGVTTITGTVVGSAGTWDKYITASKCTPTAGKVWDGTRIDKTAAATGTSTSPDSGLTATITVADELIYGDMVAGGAPSTASSGPLTAATNSNTKLHNVSGGSFVDCATVYQVVSATGTYRSSGTWQASDAWACQCVTYKETAAGGGDQTVSPPLVDSGASVFSPTVTPGAVTVSPPLVDSGPTVFSPAVAPGAVTIAPPLVDSSSSVFSPTVTPGTATISPPLVDSGAAVFTPTVTREGDGAGDAVGRLPLLGAG